jgi:phosphonopyruvate decarboxylase
MLVKGLRRVGLLQRYIRTAESGPLEETERDFLPPPVFYNQLAERGFDFFTGVPDSLLKDFCGYVSDHHPADKHVIAVNEGTAVAVAAGYHLATRKFPLVYLQNSGLGNTINPILSLVDPRVYKIPMLLMIGWRGEPGKKDEPQHMVQGKLMTSILTDVGITFEVLPDYEEGAAAALDLALYHLKSRGSPYAFLVRRQCFLKYELQKPFNMPDMPLCREEALDALVDNLGKFDIVVATTGFTSRELYEMRVKKGHPIQQDFYTVGSMGHASSIAMGIAIAKPSKQVFCFDGDGAFLMHMGAAAQVGASNLTNLKHVLLNNGAHDSVGGQPTAGAVVDFASIARACGYKYVKTVTTKEEIAAAFKELKATEGAGFLEIKLRRKTRKDLGRPKGEPKDNKEQFMNFLSQ